MKIKLCPKCGKQNDLDAWNCVDCGATLSMNTLVEVGDLSSSQIAIAGKGVLSNVSPFFQDDLTELIKNNTRSSETVLKGCDIANRLFCRPSNLDISSLHHNNSFVYLLDPNYRGACKKQFSPNVPGYGVFLAVS